MNKTGSRARVGHPESATLYEDYAVWLRRNHPHLLKQRR
jgi:hypothetical protein